ncbi:hypothetical protein [Streptomyces sp. 769]|uniref:hypothetical protein n=1 Tax=Streptomyces sp. 769 TaxID=1262452 RepID=UPI000581C82E|nr:hypothetical protein [Streptomyces sp. 769]AJC61948.1 hypothetical protein GZL_p00018 [Streptomyces sp. 769]
MSEFPADLVAVQYELAQTRAQYAQLCASLPWSAEPHPGWDDTAAEGSRRDPSDGYTPEEAAGMQRLEERLRELAASVITHAFWATLEGPERVQARTALKYV